MNVHQSVSMQPGRARQIELVVQQIESLPTLSPVATRLLSITSADDADLDEIVLLIESDPALTARIIGLCRRADKGIAHPITTVKRAVVMLGLEAVQAAVLSVSVYELMGEPPDALDEVGEPVARGQTKPAAAFDRTGFWKHAVGVACSAEIIAKTHAGFGVLPEEAFVGGLLHDLGKLVLDLILPKSYARVIQVAEQRSSPTAAVERQLIGLDHHTAGKRLAEHWSLPHALQDVMWLHSQPYATLPDLPHRRLIGLVGVAKLLCREVHIGWSGDFGPMPRLEDACEACGLDPQIARAGLADLHASVAQRCRALGIDDLTTPHMLLQSVAGANSKLARLNTLLAERSRQAHEQQKILAAISTFHGAARPARGVVDALADVVRSASALFGAGLFASIFQPRPGEPWQICQFSTEGRLVRSHVLDGPSLPIQGAEAASLAQLADPSQLSLSAVALLPWLAEYLSDAVDIRQVRILPLCADDSQSRDSGSGASRPAVVLLHDRAINEPGLSRGALQALTSTWAAAVLSAAQHEGAKRLGEELAQANRSLAEAQGRLAEAEAMARLGEMAAGAAHEMNNPLTVISGRAQLLSAIAQDEKDRDSARVIATAAEHLASLITSLHLLADPPKPDARPTDIAQLVRDAAEQAVVKTGSAQAVRIFTEELPAAVVDRDLLLKAVVEVVSNALEAAPGVNRGDGPGGDVTAEEKHPVDVQIRVQTDPLDDRLLIVVSDTGVGFSQRAAQHAFDPFFSEKPAGRKTGLGLTRARSLVELHKGRITIESPAPTTPSVDAERGQPGSVVTIELPHWRASDPMAYSTSRIENPAA